MKKATLLLLGLAAMVAAPNASADLYILTNNIDNPDCIIHRGGEFDEINKLIGFTSAGTSSGTLIEIGEVDFGDGEKYKATSIEFGNGWGTDGWAILWAGTDWDDAEPFTQMEINEYKSYYVPRCFGANMAYNVYEGGLSPNIFLMDNPIQYVKPTGKQKVFMTFEGGNGNVFGFHFYENELTEADFIQEDDADWGGDAGIRLRNPYEDPRYADKSVVIDALDMMPYVETGEDTDFPEVKIDEAEGLGHWGWTKDGLLIGTINDVDFGNNRFQQFVLFVRHGNQNVFHYLEVYIDDATVEANKIGRVWVGREMNERYYPIPVNFTKEVSGNHKLIVKWETPGGQCDLRRVALYEGTPWLPASECGLDVKIVDDIPTEGAFRFTFEGCPEGQGDPWAYEIKAKGQWEAAGNVGYTGPGTVLAFYMPSGAPIDFGDSEDDAYTHIVVEHSSEPALIGKGTIEEANFSFYLDIDPNYDTPEDEWKGNLEGILEGHDPVAIVRMQGTGGWSIRKHVRGEFLTKVTGEHDLYMVYNTPASNIGANVFNIYFEKNAPDFGGVQGVAQDVVNTTKVYGRTGSIAIEVAEATKVYVYGINGMTVASDVLTQAGTHSVAVARGIYVVKTVDAAGNAEMTKVAVR